MAKFVILSPNEVTSALKEVPDWELGDNEITASFIFPDFRAAIGFLMTVAMEADTMNHHPRLTNLYNRVEFALSTHEAGDTITDLDIKLAKYISSTAKTFLPK